MSRTASLFLQGRRIPCQDAVDVIDYLVDENRVLKGQLRGQRLRLTDDERRRLAVKGKAPGRNVLEGD